MEKFLVKFFDLNARNTTIKNELLAGAFTFLAMSYIIFLQPAILRHAGMSFGAVMTATCVASALMCILMGMIANFPVSASPLMGENLFFTFTLVVSMTFSFQQALFIILISGSIYLLLSALKLREFITASIPQSLRYALSAAIGIYIVVLGLKWAGIIVPSSATFVKLGNLKNPAVVSSIIGLFAVAILFIRGVKGSLTLGALITMIVAIVAGAMQLKGVVSPPPSIAPVFLKFGLPPEFLDPDIFFAILILLFMQNFSSIGSGINSKLPGADKVIIIDALGTPLGSCLGTSNVSSCIESNPGGVGVAGKTGLSNVVCGMLFLAALFLSPLVRTLGAGVLTTKTYTIYPVVAPVLILIGLIQLKNLLKINFNDMSEALPAAITLVCVPLTFSIAHGLAFGVISYPIIRMVQGKFKEISPLMYGLAAAFLLYYIIK